MYNFPHQINDLEKLKRALEVFDTLSTENADVDDDGVVGEAMARAGVYTFRDKTLTVDEALQQEFQKPAGQQGTRTFARDLRRFFVLSGLLARNPTTGLRVTALGQSILNATIGTPEATALWRAAMENVTLADADSGAVSRPYPTLLRLVRQFPGIESARLALALEARDESEAEFQRIAGLAQRDWDEVRDELGVSESHARNAVKILPAIARQLGDLRTDQNGNFPPPEAPAAPRIRPRPRPRPPQGAAAVPPTPARNRRVNARTIARTPNFEERPADEADYQNPEATREARRERLTRHERLVQQVAQMLETAGYALYETRMTFLLQSMIRQRF